MKNKLPLYILLVFLIIVNGFFLYTYISTGAKTNSKQPMQPKLFLVQELGFDASQKKQFDVFYKKHHEHMRVIVDEIKELKDDMFKGFSDEDFEESRITTLTKLIGEKEAAKNLEVFRYFKQVKALCNAVQKEKFNSILKDALRRGDREQGPPPGGRREGGPDGNRPPPPRNGEHMRPPPNH